MPRQPWKLWTKTTKRLNLCCGNSAVIVNSSTGAADHQGSGQLADYVRPGGGNSAGLFDYLTRSECKRVGSLVGSCEEVPSESTDRATPPATGGPEAALATHPPRWGSPPFINGLAMAPQRPARP